VRQSAIFDIRERDALGGRDQPLRRTILPATVPVARHSIACAASSRPNVRLISGSICLSASRAKIFGRSSRSGPGFFWYSALML
jgi:hypothetical protein